MAIYITSGLITFAVSTMHEITLEEELELLAVLQVVMTKHLCGFVKHYKYWSVILFDLTHWGRVMHKCVIKSNHHCFRQWLVAWPTPSHYLNQCWNIVNWTLDNWTNFNDILIKIQQFSFKKIRSKMLSGKWRPFCLGLNELIGLVLTMKSRVYRPIYAFCVNVVKRELLLYVYGFILSSVFRLAMTEPGSNQLTVFRIRGPNGTKKVHPLY